MSQEIQPTRKEEGIKAPPPGVFRILVQGRFVLSSIFIYIPMDSWIFILWVIIQYCRNLFSCSACSKLWPVGDQIDFCHTPVLLFFSPKHFILEHNNYLIHSNVYYRDIYNDEEKATENIK